MSARLGSRVGTRGWWWTVTVTVTMLRKRRYAGTETMRTCWTKPAGKQSQPQPQPGWLRKEAVRLEAESWRVTWAWGLEGFTERRDFHEAREKYGINLLKNQTAARDTRAVSCCDCSQGERRVFTVVMVSISSSLFRRALSCWRPQVVLGSSN